MELSSLLLALLLGVVQGITEFLPVSSTGHLAILQLLFGLDQATYGLSFDLFTSFGTTAAVVWYFRKDLTALVHSFRLPHRDSRPTEKEQLAWWIFGVTILVGLAGLLMEDTIATTFRSVTLIASSLAAVSLIMLLAEWLHTKQATKVPLTRGRAYAVGLAQIFAFIPGVSRSGATITTGLFVGLDRASAARYSFLLSVPVTLAASLKRLATMLVDGPSITTELAGFYLMGMVSAAVVGYYTIHFLLEFLRRYSLATFAYYRLALALLLFAYLYWF